MINMFKSKFNCLPGGRLPLGLLPPAYPALPPKRSNCYLLPDGLASEGVGNVLFLNKLIEDQPGANQEFSLSYNEKKSMVGFVSKKWLTKIVKFFKVKSTK